MTNPLANNPDAPNLGKLDPNNYTPDEFWKAFFMDMDILQPGAGEWTRQMLTMFWQNKDKINAACEAALKRIESDPKLRDMKGAESLEVGFDIVCEEYERLYGEKPTEADTQNLSKNTQRAIARGIAEERGAILSLNGHVASFSSEQFWQAFTLNNIFMLPAKADPKKIFDNNGQLDTLAQPTKELQSLEKIHTAFLMTALECVRNTEDDGSHTFSVYLPGLKLDGRTHSKERSKNTPAVRGKARLNFLINAATPFDSLVGKTPNGSFYRVLSFQEYNAESETAIFSAPYLFKLKEMAEGERPHHSAYNRLFHDTIISEPNKAAVELANRILNGVLNRGMTPDVNTGRKVKKENENQISIFDNENMAAAGVDNKKITYRVKYSRLIEDCPQLNEILQEILANDSKTKWQTYNSKLKQTFEQAYRIIMEKSDAPTYYEKFKLPGRFKTARGERKYVYDVPTKSTLNSKLIVSHYGKRITGGDV